MPVVKSLQVDFHEVIKLKKTNSFFVKLKTRFVDLSFVQSMAPTCKTIDMFVR